MTDQELIQRIEEEAKNAKNDGVEHFTPLEMIFIRDAVWKRRRTFPVKCYVKYGSIQKTGEFCLCRNCLDGNVKTYVSYEGDRSNYCRTCGAEVYWDE